MATTKPENPIFPTFNTMDINKLSNQINNGQLKGVNAAEHNQKSSEASPQKAGPGYSDKVSLEKFDSHKSEEEFAKYTLAKLNEPAFEKLKVMKAKLSEYEAAKETSADAAGETEIGNMLNDPDVHQQIAKKILR